MAEQKTYLDQSQTELYDLYDLEANEKTPDMLLNANVIRAGKWSNVVEIDYPLIDGIWSLAGTKGSTSAYAEAGKKAFVRNGAYRHPVKNWSSHLLQMAPLEYIEACADIFSMTGRTIDVSDLIKQRMDDYAPQTVFNSLVGDLFYLVLDYKKKTQEGLHRAVWALLEELEDIPVIVIK